MATTSERIEAAWLASGGLADASELAMELIAQDVAAGEYEGCSSELELAYSEYVAAAERLGA